VSIPSPQPGDVQPVAPIWANPGYQSPSAVNQPPSKDINAKWLFGWAGSWLVLVGLAELPQSETLAAALALSIAFGVSIVLLPKVNAQIQGFLA
jgi:hypothetical protein